jgi:hypothetical protein
MRIPLNLLYWVVGCTAVLLRKVLSPPEWKVLYSESIVLSWLERLTSIAYTPVLKDKSSVLAWMGKILSIVK